MRVTLMFSVLEAPNSRIDIDLLISTTPRSTSDTQTYIPEDMAT